MVRTLDRQKALALRATGKSYSEIKQLLNISKSTLSYWLADMPLSQAQMRKLRDKNPRRIENFRKTMQKKREIRMSKVLSRVKTEIGRLSKRDLFIAGLYLYWGEGTKLARGKVTIANTDPAMICSFIDWLHLMNVPHEKLRVRLHLYRDMNTRKEQLYWSKVLNIPLKQFRTPYIKDSTFAGLTYRSGHGHGTCNIHFDNVPMWEYITMALKYIREQHAPVAQR